MRLNNRRKLSIHDTPPSSPEKQNTPPHQQQNISIKPKTIQVHQKQQQFFKLTQKIMAQRGLGDQQNINLSKKESLASQISQTLGSLDQNDEEEILVELIVPIKTAGKSGKIFDGTELIKQIIKGTSQDSFVNQIKKSNRKQKKKYQPSRNQLFRELKKTQMARKSVNLTSQEIRQTFKKTSLEQLKNHKKQTQSNEQSKISSFGASQKQKQINKKEEKQDSQFNDKEDTHQEQNNESLLSDSSQFLKQNILDDSVSSEQNSSIKQKNLKKKKKHKNKDKDQNKRLKSKKKKCKYIEYQAQQSGSDVSENSSEESEDDQDKDLQDLINNDVVLNQKDEAIGKKKMLEQLQKQDELLMQKILKGQLFKRKSIPKVLPSEKIKENRRKQLNKNCTDQLQHFSNQDNLFEKREPKNKDIQKQIKNVDASSQNSKNLPNPTSEELKDITDDIYQQQKRIYEMQKFLQGHRRKSTNFDPKAIPEIFTKKLREEKSIPKLQILKKKRASLMDPKTKNDGCGRTALSTWINHRKCFLNEDETDVSQFSQHIS